MLHSTDCDRRLNYSLAATFLGRMCLSGDVDKLNDSQWKLVQAAMTLYRRAAGIVKNGISRKQGELGDSWRHPTGWQAMVRTAADRNGVLVIMHRFGGNAPHIRVTLPQGIWSMDATLVGTSAALANGALIWSPAEPFSGEVALLRKRQAR